MRKSWQILGSVGLGVAFGLQDLRAFFPSIVYGVRDRFEISSIVLGLLGIGIFAIAGWAPWWTRRRGSERAIALAVVGVSGLRAALQVWPGDPLGFLVLAAAGVLSFFALIAALVDRGPLWAAPAFLLGAALDTALHALRATEDWHWGDGVADAVIVALAMGAAVLAARSLGEAGETALETREESARLTRELEQGTKDGGRTRAATKRSKRTKTARETSGKSKASPAGRRGPSGIALFVWGPFLFLHLEWLANVARLSAKTGLPSEAAGAVIVGGLAIAIACVASIPVSRVVRGVAAVVSIAATAFASTTGNAAIPIQLAAIAAAAILLRDALIPGSGAARRPGLAMGAGAVALILFAFAHYAALDLPLPWARTHVWIAAAVTLAAAGVARNARLDAARSSTRLALVPAALAFALLLAPGSRRVAAVPAAAALPDPARIVTFNLHAGFDERGDFAFAAMMDSVRAQNADVVALQEVSRGWLINGCADLYEIARRRLPMASAFGASVDSDWGNGVFARAPISKSRNVPLPPRELALTRAVLEAEIPLTDSSMPLRVLATHFHHRAADESIREVHARFIAAHFADPGPSVLLGDFNATPGSPSLRILEQAGWSDVAGTDGAPTYPSRAPVRRIDTILFRGLDAESTEVAPAWSSDHRGVVTLLRVPDAERP